MRFLVQRIIPLILFIILTGCASVSLGNLTMLSTRPVNLENKDLGNLIQNKNIIGTDHSYIFLGVPLRLPTVDNAVDDALIKGKGDLILNPALTYEVCSIFILGRQTISVKGNVVNTKEK